MSPSRRRAIARGGSPPRCAAWQVAHAESFACRGSVRGTVRGRAAHPARCHDRAAIYPRSLRTRITPAHYPGGAMRTSRPTAITRRHYTHKIRTAHYPGGAIGTSRPTAITPAKFARALPCGAMVARGGSPPRHRPVAAANKKAPANADAFGFHGPVAVPPPVGAPHRPARFTQSRSCEV